MLCLEEHVKFEHRFITDAKKNRLQWIATWDLKEWYEWRANIFEEL